MSRKILLAGMALAPLLFTPWAAAQDRGSKSGRIDVENYAIDAEINPRTQTLTANVKVRFIPLDNDVSTASFELNGALNVSRVVDDGGRQISASRSGQDMGIRLSFPAPLAKDKPTTVTFTYDGRLTGQEESPVNGIKFAAIENDIAYLMYPARWFPVNGYSVDRFTSDLHITVPDGYQVIASGLEARNRRAPAKLLSAFNSPNRRSRKHRRGARSGGEGELGGRDDIGLLPAEAEHGQRVRRGGGQGAQFPDRRLWPGAAG